VEWQDGTGPHRAIVPADQIRDGDASADTLALGIPYGAPWEFLYEPSVSALQVARLMREHGIWTEEDLQRNVPGARAALQQAFGIDLGRLIDKAREAREGGE
jgi:hypothetical protein